MLKKLFCAAGVTAGLLLCLTATAFAEITVSEDQSAVTGYGMVSEDFENKGITANTWVADYPGATYTSDVVRKLNDAYNNRDMNLALGEGTDGSAALRVGVGYTGNRNLCVLSKNINFYEGGTLIAGMSAAITYDLRIATNPDSTYLNEYCYRIGIGSDFLSDAATLFKLQKDENGSFYFIGAGSTDTEKLYYELDKWYTLQLVQTGSTQEAYIIDKETGETLLSKVKQAAPNTNVSKQSFKAIYLNPAYVQLEGESAKSDKNMGFVAYLDNMTLTVFNANQAPALLSQSVESGAVGVARNSAILLSLDNMADAAKIKVKQGDSEITGYRVKSIGVLDKKIVFTELLDKNTTYTVDLQELGMDNISFTTRPGYILGTELLSTGIGSDKRTVTVSYKLKDDGGVETISCRLMAVLYADGKMVDAAMVDLNEARVNQELTAAFSFSSEIGENSTISVTAFEKNAFLPLSASVVCQ